MTNTIPRLLESLMRQEQTFSNKSDAFALHAKAENAKGNDATWYEHESCYLNGMANGINLCVLALDTNAYKK